MGSFVSEIGNLVRCRRRPGEANRQGFRAILSFYTDSEVQRATVRRKFLLSRFHEVSRSTKVVHQGCKVDFGTHVCFCVQCNKSALSFNSS